MSGGHFDYWQYHIGYIADSIEHEIDQNKVKPEWVDDEDWDGQKYSDETIAEFKKGVEYLRKAEIYANRIDWLLSCDDGEDTFHERLKKELAKVGASDGDTATE